MSAVEIKIRRYELRGRPGSRPSTAYEYTTPADIPWPGGRPGPRAGQYVNYGSGLADLRDMLRRKYGRNVKLTETWK